MRVTLLILSLLSFLSLIVAQTPSTCLPGALSTCITLGLEFTPDVASESPTLFYYPSGVICGVTGGFSASGVSYSINGLNSSRVLGLTPTQRIAFNGTGTNTTVTFSVGVAVEMANAPFTNASFVLTATNVLRAPASYSGSTQVQFAFTGFAQVDSPGLFILSACTPAVAVGDPQFVGLRGQSYQVHGIDGAIYNIVSDKNLQVNSRFVFLTEGQCPMINGVADTNCWSHPGSYMGELSFQQVVDGKLHAALITSGSAKSGFSMVQMDGKAIAVGASVKFGSFAVTAVTSHKVVISTEQFSFELTNSDNFINQALSPKVALSKLTAHGLLGQTHSTRMHSSTLRYIEGEVDDYSIASGDIFGDDFVYNQFQA